MSQSNRAGMQLHFTFQNYFFLFLLLEIKTSHSLYFTMSYTIHMTTDKKKPRETSHFANWHQFHWTHSWVCFTSTNKRWANVMSNYILKRHTKKSPVLSLCSTSLDTRSLPVEQTCCKTVCFTAPFSSGTALRFERKVYPGFSDQHENSVNLNTGLSWLLTFYHTPGLK